MHLPFTTAQFIAVFTGYNAAIGVAPLVAYSLAAATIYFTFRPGKWGDRFVSLALAAMWAFTGIGYHLMSFSRISPPARIFGVLFVVQAILLAVEGLRGRLHFRFSARDFRSRTGIAITAFAMAIYPLIGMLSGHGYPNGPAFGVTPCPLAIFTFGMLLLTDRTLPKYLLAIPLVWALIGSTAALAFGIREDAGLLVTGLIATTALLARRSSARVTSAADSHSGRRGSGKGRATRGLAEER